MRRLRETASVACTSSPVTRTVPVLGSVSRLISRNSVVLPEPDGPTTATNSCSRTVSVRAYFYMTRQLGMNPGANHETLIGIRKATGSANDEIRFGEIK